MSTPLHPSSGRFLSRTARFLAVAAAAALAASTAQAAVRTFKFKFSGAAFGNQAVATGAIELDDALLVYPVPPIGASFSPTSLVRSVVLDVSGASSGNGHFVTADFSGYVLSISTPLDLAKEWVGQPQNGGGSVIWGPVATASLQVGDLNFFRADGKPSPTGFDHYTLQTLGGQLMRLVSVTETLRADAVAGGAVQGLTGVSVATVRPGAMDENGFLYYHGKLAGAGVAPTTSECLLKAFSPASILLARAGDALAGGTIKTFGDPMVRAGKLCVKAQLVSGIDGVTTANDEVLASMNTAGGGLSVVAQEGAAVSQPAGFHFYRFDWVHLTSAGVYFGATLADNSPTPVKRASVWFYNGSTALPVAVVGGTVTISGALKTIKTLSKPTASTPAQAEVRVGNDSEISLLLRTTDGATLLKTFAPPAP